MKNFMAVHLLSYLKEQFTPAVVDQLSSRLNESSANTLKVINGTVPTLLGALTRRVQATGGASTLVSFLDKGDYATTPLDVSQAVTATTSGSENATATQNFLDHIFDDKQSRAAELLSVYSGTKPASVQAVMQMAGSVLMGVLGRQEQEKGLTADSLKTLLLGQASEFRQALPTGLESIEGLLGFDELVTPAGPQTEVQGTDNLSGTPINPNIPKSAEGDRRKENVRWLRWAMIAIAVLVLALLVQKCRENQNSTDGISTDSTARVESNASEDTSAATKESIRQAHGQVGDSTVPGPLGIRDSTERR